MDLLTKLRALNKNDNNEYLLLFDAEKGISRLDDLLGLRFYDFAIVCLTRIKNKPPLYLVPYSVNFFACKHPNFSKIKIINNVPLKYCIKYKESSIDSRSGVLN